MNERQPELWETDTMRTDTVHTAKTTATVRLMIVDDNPEVRYLLSCAMDGDDRFEMVGEASTAREALDRATAVRPDAVLVDLFLVGKKGSWLLRKLRQSLPETRLVAVTGSDEPEVHAAAMDAGADAVLVKRDLTTTLLDKIFDVTQ